PGRVSRPTDGSDNEGEIAADRLILLVGIGRVLFLRLDDAVRTAVRIAAYRPALCGATFLHQLAPPAFGQPTGGVQQEARPGGERRIPGIDIFRQAQAFALRTIEK